MKHRISRPFTFILVLLAMNLMGTALAATEEDFVGKWKGDGTFVSAGETDQLSVIMVLKIDGDELSGTVDIGTSAPTSISGTVENSVFIFDWPNPDPANPDCANWDVTGRATLNETHHIMELKVNGIFCGPSGGNPGSFEGLLYKQTNPSGILFFLLLN